MIHNIVIPWPNAIFDDLNSIKEVKGDTINFIITIIGLDISEYKVRAELTDTSNIIPLKNEAAGGSDAEIVEVESESGTSAIKIIVPAGKTEDFLKYAILEVELETPNGNIFTVLQQKIIFLDQNIDWA